MDFMAVSGRGFHARDQALDRFGMVEQQRFDDESIQRGGATRKLLFGFSKIYLRALQRLFRGQPFLALLLGQIGNRRIGLERARQAIMLTQQRFNRA